MRALEHALQRLQLAAVERRAVPPLLLLPLGGTAAPRAGALTCGGAARGSAGPRTVGGGSPHAPSRSRPPPAPRRPRGHHSGTARQSALGSLLRAPSAEGWSSAKNRSPFNSRLRSPIHPSILHHISTEHLRCGRRSARARGRNGKQNNQAPILWSQGTGPCCHEDN